MENIFWIVLAIISIVAAMLPFRSQIMNFLQKIKLPRFTMPKISILGVIWVTYIVCLGTISWGIGWGFREIIHGVAKGLSKWYDIGMPSIWTIPIIVASISFVGISILAIEIESVPENRYCLVEIFGKYIGQKNPGPHLRLRWVMCFRGIEKNEIRIPFFIKDEKVELKDANPEFEACFWCQVTDPIKALYATQNYKTDIRKKMADAFKGLFGSLTLVEARTYKGNATIDDILDSDSERLKQKTYKTINKELEDCNLWKKFRNEWGIEIRSAAIGDIILPKKIEDAINSIAEAENEAEAEIYKKKKAITKAEGEKAAAILKAEANKKDLELTGLGEAERIEKLKKAGLTSTQAVEVMAQERTMSAVGPNAKTVFVDPGSISGLGAKFAAGMDSTKP